ncbi:MAG TPA: hypothetical protein VK071_11850, partial [Tissierellales bacterium]|nr:hypothetical protein [Tissierellales bacterium]
IFETQYSSIESETTYYVPLNKTYEVWEHKVRNLSNRERKISIFGYAEFTNESDYEQDTVNLQYSLFVSKTYFKDNKIIQSIKENSDEACKRFFGLVNAPISSYSGDKKSFIGNYNSYGNPKAVVEGQCENTLNYNLNSCGALHTQLKLMPGEERKIIFVLGQDDEIKAEEILSFYKGKGNINTYQELEELKEYWKDNLSALKVKTPDKNFDHMVNTWNPYQCFLTFIWSRAASFTYCGHRNGYGYRDTVQDIQGVIHLLPELAKKQLVFMLSAQVSNGAGLPLVKYNHNPGKEDTPDDFSYVKETGHPSYRADDALWLFPTIKKYINETGDISFLDEIVAYADKGHDSVYEHLRKAIEFSLNNLGNNGLPVGLYADWNDCLRLGEKGESTFVAMQLYYGLNVMEEFANIKNDYIYIEDIGKIKVELGKIIDRECFEGDRYIRGITEDNLRIGSKENIEASLWLNPQSWAIISGLAGFNRGKLIMDNVFINLSTDYGARLMAPSFKDQVFKGALATVYNGSTKENGSIFLQTQGWLILAETLIGNGNRAYEYYKKSSPAHQNQLADIRQMEPYVYGQFTESVESPFEGRSHLHWLTGTASTVMVACVEGILGIRPDIHGIRIEPTIPNHWEEIAITKIFRGKKININIYNKNGNQSGYKEIYLNGVKLDNNYVQVSQLRQTNDIEYIM